MDTIKLIRSIFLHSSIALSLRNKRINHTKIIQQQSLLAVKYNLKLKMYIMTLRPNVNAQKSLTKQYHIKKQS